MLNSPRNARVFTLASCFRLNTKHGAFEVTNARWICTDMLFYLIRCFVVLPNFKYNKPQMLWKSKSLNILHDCQKNSHWTIKKYLPGKNKTASNRRNKKAINLNKYNGQKYSSFNGTFEILSLFYQKPPSLMGA